MTRSFLKALFVFTVLALPLLWLGCGGGGGSSTLVTRTTTSPASMVQVTIGDGPGSRVASLSVTVTSVTLTPSSGSAVNLLSAPVAVEITQLAGTTTPLATVSVPGGTYSQVTIALGAATISFVDLAGNVVQKTLPAPPPVTITLSPAFVSSGSPLVLNLDLNLDASIQINDATATITFNPRFLAAHGPMTGPPAGAPPDPFTGGVEHMLGAVSSVSGSSFTISGPMQRSLTFTTNTSTVFVNTSGIGGLAAGMLVMVNAQMQSDGTLLATRVVTMNPLTSSTGMTGVVAKTTGSPVTQFQLVTHNLIAGALFPAVNSTGMPVSLAPTMGMTVNVSSTTTFRYNTDGVDLTGITLPAFSAGTLFAGQVVEVDTAGPVLTASGTTMGPMLPMFGTLDATGVELEQQPVIGVVSNYSGGATFTLTVPNDSVLAVVAGTTSITVFKQPGTMLLNNLALANGQAVMVRGLLFGDSGLKLLATRIGQLPVVTP